MTCTRFGVDGAGDPVVAAGSGRCTAPTSPRATRRASRRCTRGHYFLPILNGATVVDVLVCRLNQGAQARPAWTRLSGHAPRPAYAGRSRPGQAPELLGLSGQRVTSLSGLLTPAAANKQDADGTTHVLDVIENDVELANRSTTQKVDLLYELQDAAADDPTITGSWASGAEGSTWTGCRARRRRTTAGCRSGGG
jgi:hypothetical protein